MLRICRKCGTEYEGDPGSSLCPSCVAADKKSTIRTRVCKQCGRKFPGGPRAWYCPECRAERKKEAGRRHRQKGTSRPIGSVDVCEICGKPYTVNSARQRYCPACAAEAVRAVDREQGRKWNRENVDVDARREQRHDATAELLCVICGKPYKPGNGTELTCSPECAAELRRRTSARWEKDHRADRTKYHAEREAAKLRAMTHEERRAYQDKLNARARENYARRKDKKND